MSTLGDLLSNESKESLMGVFDRGDVIRLKLTENEGITPKKSEDDSRNKYFIILGKTIDGNLIGFVVINSEINRNLPQHLKDLHYPISSEKYPFLLKNRFVNCGDLKEIQLKVFSERYNCKSFGKIQESDLKLITEAVITSGNVSPKRLKRFGLIH